MVEEKILERLKNSLEIPKEAKTFKEILELDLTHIKGITFKIASVLKKVLKVYTIKDLAKKEVDEEEFLMLKLLGINTYDLNVWVFISRMINKKKVDEFFGVRKISIVGLDNAGKTAILHILQNKLNIDLFSKLAPTIGVNRDTIEKFGIQYTVLDMGGQEKYRREYIQKAEKYFIKVELLIFVIDIQDSDRFDKALEYLQEIIKIIELLKENPEYLIMLNKVDPDIKDNEDIKESVRLLETKINEMFQNTNFQHDIVSYSIYNSLGDSKSVTKNVRDFLVREPEEKPDLKEFVRDSLERILNIMITLNSNIEERFSKIEESIQSIREWNEYTKTSQTLTPPPIPPDLKNSKEFQKLKDTQSLKQSLRDELKLFLKMKKVD